MVKNIRKLLNQYLQFEDRAFCTIAQQPVSVEGILCQTIETAPPLPGRHIPKSDALQLVPHRILVSTSHRSERYVRFCYVNVLQWHHHIKWFPSR